MLRSDWDWDRPFRDTTASTSWDRQSMWSFWEKLGKSHRFYETNWLEYVRIFQTDPRKLALYKLYAVFKKQPASHLCFWDNHIVKMLSYSHLRVVSTWAAESPHHCHPIQYLLCLLSLSGKCICTLQSTKIRENPWKSTISINFIQFQCVQIRSLWGSHHLQC